MLYSIELDNKTWMIKEYDKKSKKSQTKSSFSNRESRSKSYKREAGLFLNPYELLKRV